MVNIINMIMVTQEEYLKNRQKKSMVVTIWDAGYQDDISPDELIERIKKNKENLLRNGMGVEESSIVINICNTDEDYPQLDINWEQWETMDEYEKRKEREQIYHDNRIRHLQIEISSNFEEAAAYVDLLRKKMKERNKNKE